MSTRLTDMIRDATLEKAATILEENRVLLRGTRALVAGSSGFHRIEATEHEVICDCEAGRHGRSCSHALAAMVAWHEHEGAPW